MLAIVLLLSLCAHLGYSAPNRCVMFCDEDQLSAGYIQQPVQHQPIQTSYNFFRPAYPRSYVPSNGLTPVGGRITSINAQQPVYGRTYPSPAYVQPAHTEVFEPVSTQTAGFPSQSNIEGVIYHSSSSSHNSQTHGILKFPGIQTGKIVTQYEPLRTNPCVNQYVDPCGV